MVGGLVSLKVLTAHSSFIVYGIKCARTPTRYPGRGALFSFDTPLGYAVVREILCQKMFLGSCPHVLCARQ